MDTLLRRLFYSLAYLKNPRWDTGITPPEVYSFIAGYPAGRALDLGCGTGTNLVTLAKGGWQVSGVDFIPRVARQARHKILAAGYDGTVLAGDVTGKLPLKGSFDLVLDIGCFHSIPLHCREGYLENLRGWLSSGGTYLLYGFIGGAEDLPPVLAEDEERFDSFLHLISKVIGSESDGRKSAWWRYEKQ